MLTGDLNPWTGVDHNVDDSIGYIPLPTEYIYRPDIFLRRSTSDHLVNYYMERNYYISVHPAYRMEELIANDRNVGAFSCYFHEDVVLLITL